jgi:hypothetical protein
MKNVRAGPHHDPFLHAWLSRFLLPQTWCCQSFCPVAFTCQLHGSGSVIKMDTNSRGGVKRGHPDARYVRRTVPRFARTLHFLTLAASRQLEHPSSSMFTKSKCYHHVLEAYGAVAGFLHRHRLFSLVAAVF